MHNTILTIILLLGVTISAQAQFNTISSKGHFGRKITATNTQHLINKVSKPMESVREDENVAEKDTTIATGIPNTSDQKRNVRKSGEKPAVGMSKPMVSDNESNDRNRSLPELTIPNLLAEIERNGIKYPKIVLAQAILETGWFRSSVCRNKHNLFGLTNPRTKNYYEFNHWTESVRAYYTKVQYRYKGGNYLLWLRNIGYAEDPGYIRAVIRVLKQQ